MLENYENKAKTGFIFTFSAMTVFLRVEGSNKSSPYARSQAYKRLRKKCALHVRVARRHKRVGRTKTCHTCNEGTQATR